MRKLVFISFAALGFCGINEKAQGMNNHCSNNVKNDWSGVSDHVQIQTQDFDNSHRESHCCCGKEHGYDEYQSVAMSYENQIVSMIRQTKNLIIEIERLNKENSELREKSLNSNLELVQNSECALFSSKFDAMLTLTDMYNHIFSDFAGIIMELSEKLKKLKEENQTLKKTDSLVSA